MLVFNFDRLFKAKGIEKPFSYMRKSGFSENTASRIINNRLQRLSLKFVERLCELFQCTPNDLLEWVPSDDVTNVDKHPLATLQRRDTVMNLTKLLNSVPLNRLLEIEQIVKNELEK